MESFGWPPSPSPESLLWDKSTSFLPQRELTITDKTTEITVEETLSPVNIAFNTPEWMAYGQTTTIELLLDLTKSASELKAMIKSQDPIESDRVNISHVMEARLTGEAFEITPATHAEQLILQKTVTRWTWDVRPKRLNTQVLHLSLTTKLDVRGVERAHSFPVFDRDIVVRIRGLASAISAAKDNWPIVTAAAAPLAGLLGWLVALIRKRRSANI